MDRLKLEDSIIDVMTKMAGGNPGAIQALVQIMENSERIDPQAAGGGLLTIISLDTYRIYGTDIYVLYNDKCNRDIRQMLMLLRAVQLGFLPQAFGKMEEIGLYHQIIQQGIMGYLLQKIDVSIWHELELMENLNI